MILERSNVPENIEMKYRLKGNKIIVSDATHTILALSEDELRLNVYKLEADGPGTDGVAVFKRINN
jgi:hypothetical protein